MAELVDVEIVAVSGEKREYQVTLHELRFLCFEMKLGVESFVAPAARGTERLANAGLLVFIE